MTRFFSNWLVVVLFGMLCSTQILGEEGDQGEEKRSFVDCDGCPEMVVLPAGKVTIGSYPDEAYRKRGERPKQQANIEYDFAMAKTEVTLAQYRTFVEDTNHQPEVLIFDGKTIEGCNYFDGKGYGYVRDHSWQNSGYPQREDSPVVCVSWSDAAKYSEWLTEKAGRAYRVPSTVEFEYAFRAGASTPWPWGADTKEACTYANVADQTFGDTYPKRAQFPCDDGYLYSASVAKFEPNAFGLYDVFGNAWEWTNDCWHDDLTEAPTDGSSWLENDGGDCTARTPKGGGWISGPAWARAAVRSKDGAHYRSFMLGFRVAADIEK